MHAISDRPVLVYNSGKVLRIYSEQYSLNLTTPCQHHGQAPSLEPPPVSLPSNYTIHPTIHPYPYTQCNLQQA